MAQIITMGSKPVYGNLYNQTAELIKNVYG